MIYNLYSFINLESFYIQSLKSDKIIEYSKHFFKPFIEITAILEDKYPLYKQQDNEHYII